MKESRGMNQRSTPSTEEDGQAEDREGKEGAPSQGSKKRSLGGRRYERWFSLYSKQRCAQKPRSRCEWLWKNNDAAHFWL